MAMTHHNVTLLTHTDISLSCPILPQSHSYFAQPVTRTPSHHHIIPVLKSLHWPKIPERINLQSPVPNLQLLAVGPYSQPIAESTKMSSLQILVYPDLSDHSSSHSRPNRHYFNSYILYLL